MWNALADKGREGTLAEAIREHGADAFVIVELAVAENLSQLAKLEKKYIQQHKTQHPNGYNIKPGGEIRFASRKTFSLGGKRFDSLPAAARHFSLDESTLRHRVNKGWSEGQVLGVEPPPPPSYAKAITIDGKKFVSMKDAALGHGIDIGTVQYRLNVNWTIEQAFGLEPPPQNISPLAHKTIVSGKPFRSKRAAALAHNVDYSAFKARLRLGWSLEQALELEERS